MTIDRDDWSEHDLLEGDNYAQTCDRAIGQILSDLAQVQLSLHSDKRAVVEITALLEIAAGIAQRELHMSGDDFAIAASDVFMRS